MTEKNLKELLRQAFEAGRTWQIAEVAEYNGGNENEKPNFNEWYKNIIGDSDFIKHEVERLVGIILSEQNSTVRETMIRNLLISNKVILP